MIQLAIIGTSAIAHQFAAEIAQVPGITLTGVHSRDAARAVSAAKGMGARRPWWDLPAMLASSEVDAVYIASPNSIHRSQCEDALKAGKHVLVEKPAVTTTREFQSLMDLASSRGLVILEGLPSAYDPGMAVVRELLPEIGVVRRVSFEYSKRSARYDLVLAGQRVNIFDPAMAGGALNDLGVYCVSAMVDLFGAPESVIGEHVMIRSGADGAGAALARYPGFVAQLGYSKITTSTRPSQVEGELGTLTIDNIALPSRISLQVGDAPGVERSIERSTSNLRYEIERFVQLVQREEVPTPDQQRTLLTLGAMEAIRAST